MSASAIIFYAISAFLLTTGLLSVTTKKIFRSAIFLLFSLIGVAALYFWMDVQFVAAVQIVVYVGGIVVLIIFSIFLTEQSGKQMAQPKLKRVLWSLAAGLFGFGFTFNLINSHALFHTTPVGVFSPDVRNIGLQMLSPTEHGYILPFEVVSMLLLAAMIGCIVIAIKTGKNTSNPTREEVGRLLVPNDEQLNKPAVAKTISQPLTAQEV